MNDGATPASNLDPDRLSAHYRTMLRIRRFEEQAEAALGDGRVKGAIHLSIGQEAVAAGICGNLERGDFITTTHRGHGHTLAKGASPEAMMRELFGKAGGTSGGKGGSMHIADFDVGMLGANGVVGAGILIAAGAAHGVKLRGEEHVVVCFFGDGAINRGPFLEGLNWAVIYNLPILFVCEDNTFSAMTYTGEVTGGAGAAARAEAIGIPSTTLDGNDLAAIDGWARDAIAEIRAGKGPRFLQAMTYRLKGHTAADPAAYRKPDELDAKWAEDPMARLRGELLKLGVAEEALAKIEAEADAEMAKVAEAATAADWPPVAAAWSDVQDIGAASPERPA